MKIVVTGGRNYGRLAAERDMIFSIMDGYYSEDLHLAHGAANGVDQTVDEWFRKRAKGAIHNRLVRYPSDWTRFGNSAGHKRNEAMLDFEKPDILIRFPGGAGTADCAREATKRRITIHEYDRTGKGKVITFDDIFDVSDQTLVVGESASVWQYVPPSSSSHPFGAVANEPIKVGDLVTVRHGIARKAEPGDLVYGVLVDKSTPLSTDAVITDLGYVEPLPAGTILTSTSSGNTLTIKPGSITISDV